MYQLQPNSIELWAIKTDKEFKRSQLPMTEEQYKALISCYLNQKYIDEDKELLEKLEKKQFLLLSVQLRKLLLMKSARTISQRNL